LVVAIVTVDLYLPGNGSLKDKRQVLQSLKAGLRNRFNISVAETGHHDLWQRAEIGIAAISPDRLRVQKEVDRILKFIGGRSGVDLVGESVEFI